MDQNCVLVEYTLNGDVKLDGRITFDDYWQTNNGYWSNGAKTGCQWGDFNYDDKINFDDYYLINQSFLGQSAAAASSQSAPLAAVARPKAAPAKVFAHAAKPIRHNPHPRLRRSVG